MSSSPGRAAGFKSAAKAAARMLSWLQRSPRASSESIAASAVGSTGYSYIGSSTAGISDAESMAPSLMTWLESIKVGYGDKFLPAFMAVGIEDIFDLAHIDQDIWELLQVELEACGAKRMHLKNVHAGMVEAGMQEDIAPESWRSPEAMRPPPMPSAPTLPSAPKAPQASPQAPPQAPPSSTAAGKRPVKKSNSLKALSRATASSSSSSSTAGGGKERPRTPPSSQRRGSSRLGTHNHQASSSSAPPPVARGIASASRARPASSDVHASLSSTAPPSLGTATLTVGNLRAAYQTADPKPPPPKYNWAAVFMAPPPEVSPAPAATPPASKRAASPAARRAAPPPPQPPPPQQHSKTPPRRAPPPIHPPASPVSPCPSSRRSGAAAATTLPPPRFVTAALSPPATSSSPARADAPARSPLKDESIHRLIDPSPNLERRLGSKDAHDARLSRLTSVNALPTAPSRVTNTSQFKSELPRGLFLELAASAAPPPPPKSYPTAVYDMPAVTSPASPTMSPAGRMSPKRSPAFVSCGGAAAAEAAEAAGAAPAAAAAAAAEATPELESAQVAATVASSTTFAFGEPPEWLVKAAAEGCHSLADVAARTSLEHQGPIDALEQDPAVLAEYNRWLLQASKRADYLKQRAVEARREETVVRHKEDYKQHGAALQRAAWSQRGKAIEEKQRLVELNQAKARHGKREAEERHKEKEWRDAHWRGYTAAVHAELADATEEARQAKAAVVMQRHAGARTLRAATGAIERRKNQLQAEDEAAKRAIRDRVRASTMVNVPAHIAARVGASHAAGSPSKGGGGAMSNPDSVLNNSVASRAGGRAARSSREQQRTDESGELEC